MLHDDPESAIKRLEIIDFPRANLRTAHSSVSG
jgi:hypothetical protein